MNIPRNNLPNLTSKKKGVWANPHGFDETLVNPNVDLHSLGLANFRGIYSLEKSPFDIMKNIRQICKLSCRHTTICPKTVRVRYEINGIWVSEGTGRKPGNANAASINNSLIYLIQRKGLQVLAQEHILPKHVMKIAQETLLAGCQGVGEERKFDLVRLNVAKCLTEFLMDFTMMKLELGVRGFSQVLRNDTSVTANKCKLAHKIRDNIVHCWKVNSTYHNLFDRPTARLAARVPPIEQMLSRNEKKKNKRSGGAISLGDIQNARNNQTKTVFAAQTLVQTPLPTPAQTQGQVPVPSKHLKKMEKRKRKQEKKRKNKEELDKIKTAMRKEEALPKEVSTENLRYPFNMCLVNPEFCKNRTRLKTFLKGFKFMAKGWEDQPLFLLEISALCSGFQWHFVIEPLGQDDKMTVKLIMRNGNRGNKLFWISMGTGDTFADAKFDCAKNAINFLRSYGNFGKFNNSEWSRYLQKCKNPDHVWRFSKDDLGTDFLLAQSHHEIQQDNIGYRMLQKLGWSPNTGIGKYRQGILTPIEVWVRYNGYSCLGYQDPELEQGSVLGSLALQEILVRFKNNFDAWKLEFDDITSVQNCEIIMKECSALKLKSLFYQKERVLVVWKTIFQAMGITTERSRLKEYDYEISDEETLLPAARRHVEQVKFGDGVSGTSLSTQGEGQFEEDQFEEDVDGEDEDEDVYQDEEHPEADEDDYDQDFDDEDTSRNMRIVYDDWVEDNGEEDMDTGDEEFGDGKDDVYDHDGDSYVDDHGYNAGTNADSAEYLSCSTENHAGPSHSPPEQYSPFEQGNPGFSQQENSGFPQQGNSGFPRERPVLPQQSHQVNHNYQSQNYATEHRQAPYLQATVSDDSQQQSAIHTIPNLMPGQHHTIQNLMPGQHHTIQNIQNQNIVPPNQRPPLLANPRKSNTQDWNWNTVNRNILRPSSQSSQYTRPPNTAQYPPNPSAHHSGTHPSLPQHRTPDRYAHYAHHRPYLWKK